MRIIGGRYKSRRIQIAANLKARPTTDFARESLFNILNNLVEWSEISALDLFSGTGAVAIEMVSRGCSRVLSVELNSKHYNFICKAKEMLKADELTPIKGDAFRLLHTLKEQFDLIFADPPYDLQGVDKIPLEIFNNNLLKPEGILVLEHSKLYNFSDNPSFLEERTYGSVHFSLFQNKG